MDKDEMIEEMASIICVGTLNEGICEKCDFKKHEHFGFIYQCRKFDDAEALYNAGYRKVAEDEIVESMKTYERARQETAREILQDIMTKISSFEVAGLTIKSVDINIDFVKDLAQKYGVELE